MLRRAVSVARSLRAHPKAKWGLRPHNLLPPSAIFFSDFVQENLSRWNYFEGPGFNTGLPPSCAPYRRNPGPHVLWARLPLAVPIYMHMEKLLALCRTLLGYLTAGLYDVTPNLLLNPLARCSRDRVKHGILCPRIKKQGKTKLLRRLE